MKRYGQLAIVVVCALASAAPRWMPDKKEQSRVRICIYHVATGKHLEFLKWMAAQDEVAKEAEMVYWDDLGHNRENGWSLFGLGQALRAEGRNDEAAAIEARFQKAWARADVKLTASRF